MNRCASDINVTKGSPLVLSATVPKRDIALFHNGRNESEVVLTRPPALVTIDGGRDDWADRFQRKQPAMLVPFKRQQLDAIRKKLNDALVELDGLEAVGKEGGKE